MHHNNKKIKKEKAELKVSISIVFIFLLSVHQTLLTRKGVGCKDLKEQLNRNSVSEHGTTFSIVVLISFIFAQ